MNTQPVEFAAEDGVVVHGELDRPDGKPVGAALLLHGLGVARNEDEESEAGIPPFFQLAEALTTCGFAVLRFDFRGHGESEISSQLMTVKGEVADAQAAFRFVEDQVHDVPIVSVAASFGSLAGYELLQTRDGIRAAVLWNPLVDVRETFVEPKLPWGRQTFGADGIQNKETADLGGFVLGGELLAELRDLDLKELPTNLPQPILVIHGSSDTYVSCATSRRFAFSCARGSFLEVPGAQHGFGSQADRPLLLSATAEWLRLHVTRS